MKVFSVVRLVLSVWFCWFYTLINILIPIQEKTYFDNARLETSGGDYQRVSTPRSPSLALKETQRTPAQQSSRSHGLRRWRGSESPVPMVTSMAGGLWRWLWSVEMIWDRSCWLINISHFSTGSGQRRGCLSMSGLTSKIWFWQQDQLMTFREPRSKLPTKILVSLCASMFKVCCKPLMLLFTLTINWK